MRAARGKPEVGDVFRIPLGDGNFGFAQYVMADFDRPNSHGHLLRIFALRNGPSPSEEELFASGDAFPPMYVGLPMAIRKAGWEKILHCPVVDFAYPTFRYCPPMEKGVNDGWFLWDGSEMKPIGKLPLELRKLNLLCIVGPLVVVRRLLTGESLEQVML